MIKKIRQGLYETNSSSMHSFVIAKNPKIEVHKEDFEPYIKDGVLTIKGEYYTYGPEQIANQYEKTCYVLANRYDEGLKEHLEQVDKLKALLKEKLGVKEVIVDIENACVEHNSIGLVIHCGSIEEFIFSDGILYIDSDLDNCYYEKDYKEIIKNKNLKHIR